eukprot:scaffold122422_cov63-Phaeocystis_antarctica.AAC.2
MPRGVSGLSERLSSSTAASLSAAAALLPAFCPVATWRRSRIRIEARISSERPSSMADSSALSTGIERISIRAS